MSLPENFYVDVRQITIAHEFTLDKMHKCEYTQGRGSHGLVFVIDGQAEYRFTSGERITATKGDALLISPESAYRIVAQKPFRHYTVNFNVHKRSSLIKELEVPPGVLKIENTERFELIFKRLVNTWNSKNTNYEMLSVSILYELLVDFYSAYISNNDKATERILISKEYIEQHFDQDISLVQLANLSNMSITNFRREWAKHFEEPPLRYRDSIRLHYAKEYLKSKYYTVSETAAKCGFGDVNYFVRFFKKHTGISPGKF